MKYWLLALIGVMTTVSAPAVEVASLFTAEVPLDQRERDPRAAAYDAALREVVLRVSGSEVLADADLYEALFPDPAAYVVQFQPGARDTLVVTFDGQALERTLRSAGQTVWGGDRPLTLVWLAVDWGQGEREIVGAADVLERPDDGRSGNRNRQLRDRVLDVAARRGLPVAFPLLDSEDLERIEFSDVWGGFDERVIAASARYDVNSILIGRVRATGAVEQARWTYFFGDEQRNWSGQAETVMAQVSELLASQFAIGGNEPVRAVTLRVGGITSVEAYGDVQQTLASVNVIEHFTVAEVAGDRVTFRVDAHGGAERLARALRFEGLVEQDRIDMSAFGVSDPALDTLDFFYGP